MDNFKTAGAVSWHELSSTDVEAAKAYYVGLFGWTLEPMEMPGMPYTVIKVGGEPIGGISASRDGKTGWQDYVTVADIEATVARARSLGATVLVDITEIPTVGRFATLADPQGGVIAAIQYLES